MSPAAGRTSEDRASQDEAPEPSSAEHLSVQGSALAAKVRELVHEGNVRRIVVKNHEGHTVVEIPVTAGVVAAVVAPVLTAVAAIGALASDWQIEVQRGREHHR